MATAEDKSASPTEGHTSASLNGPRSMWMVMRAILSARFVVSHQQCREMSSFITCGARPTSRRWCSPPLHCGKVAKQTQPTQTDTQNMHRTIVNTHTHTHTHTLYRRPTCRTKRDKEQGLCRLNQRDGAYRLTVTSLIFLAQSSAPAPTLVPNGVHYGLCALRTLFITDVAQ